MKIKLLTLTLFTVLLVSCSSTETVADKDIDASLKKTIKTKNDSLFQAMKYSDYKALKKLGSPDFVKFMAAKLRKDNIIWAFRNGFFNSGNYTVVHEFYNNHGKAVGSAVIEDEKDNYTFTYTHKQEETYICMLKFSDDNVDDYLLTIMYGLVDGQWKLNDIEVGLYALYNKNAQDYFALAEKAKENGYLFDAWFYYDAAISLKDPCNKMLKYNNEEKMDFAAKTTREKVGMKYKFPNTMEKIVSRPKILDIAPVKNAKGLYPYISYESVIPVSDTVTLRKEFELLKQEVKKRYTDINYDNNFVYYRAYNDYTGNTYTFEDVKKK